ncbi:MAG: DUF58 domain-containing protein [Acidiferrobacterales bacterium]
MVNQFLLRNFRLVYQVSHWIQRRFTRAGQLVLVAIVATGALGVDTELTLAYQAFTLFAVLVLVGVVSSVFYRAHFRVSRQLPDFGTVGEALTYRITVGNRSRKTQRDLVLMENLKLRFPSYREYCHIRQPGEEQQNWFDRVVGYPRWAWLMRQRRGVDISEYALAPIPPGEETELSVTVMPLRRGYINFAGAIIARPDPFGLFRAFARTVAHDALLVLPPRYPVPEIQLLGSRRYQQGGVALASSVGDAQEFFSLRDYRPGDPLRHIHWRTWARRGEPVVKKYQDEYFVRHALVLDTFIGTLENPIFEDAVSAAASFTYSVQQQDALLDLMFVGTEAYRFTTGRSLSSIDSMMEVLACVEPCLDKPFAELQQLVIHHASQLSGAICILLAWDKTRQVFVKTLRGMGIPLLVLVVSDEASAPDLDPGPMADQPQQFYQFRTGRIAEGLAALRIEER